MTKKLSKKVQQTITSGHTIQDVLALMIEENIGLLRNWKTNNLYSTDSFNLVVTLIKETNKEMQPKSAEQKVEDLKIDKVIHRFGLYALVSSFLIAQVRVVLHIF